MCCRNWQGPGSRSAPMSAWHFATTLRCVVSFPLPPEAPIFLNQSPLANLTSRSGATLHATENSTPVQLSLSSLVQVPMPPCRASWAWRARRQSIVPHCRPPWGNWLQEGPSPSPSCRMPHRIVQAQWPTTRVASCCKRCWEEDYQ